MKALSYPFRLLPNGSLATVEEGSDAAHGEAIAVLVLTRPGERELEPTFGLSDPTFDAFDGGELSAAMDVFGPSVALQTVEADFVDDVTQEVTVTYA